MGFKKIYLKYKFKKFYLKCDIFVHSILNIDTSRVVLHGWPVFNSCVYKLLLWQTLDDFSRQGEMFQTAKSYESFILYLVILSMSSYVVFGLRSHDRIRPFRGLILITCDTKACVCSYE